jgi:hypothetical protein
MTQRIVLAAVLLLALVIAAPQAQAQCPAGAFEGAWVFEIEGFAFPNLAAVVSAGRMIAFTSPDPQRPGLPPRQTLAITASSSISGSPVRNENDAGRWALKDDCSGGTLTFNLSSRPAQFDFYFVNGSRIVFVSTNNGDILRGSAVRYGTSG